MSKKKTPKKKPQRNKAERPIFPGGVTEWPILAAIANKVHVYESGEQKTVKAMLDHYFDQNIKERRELDFVIKYWRYIKAFITRC